MADLTLNIISNMSGATAQVNEFTNAMKRATSAVSSTGAAVKKTGSAVSTAAAHVAKLGHSANKTAGFFGKLNRSLARIAVYRTMRKAIAYVGEAFKKGLEAAYQFSKASQPAEYAKLAGAMDGIKKAASTMSLQLGAAFGGLITAIAPILIRIINLVTAAADAITRFFAVLNGSGYYKKAASGFEEVGNSAGGAGKKIKGLLASWDELNVIGKESGGGGGGSSSADYSGAYEWVPAQSELATAFLEGNLNKVGEIVGNKLREWGEKIEEWFGKYFGNDYEYWRTGLEGLVDFVSGLLRGMGFDTAADNLELFAEKVKAALGLASEYYNAFLEAIENSKLNIIVLSLDKALTYIKRDFNALCLSIATDIQNSPFLRKIFGDQSAYIFKMDAEVSEANNKLGTIDKKIAELVKAGDNGVDIDAHVNHEKVDKYKETLKKPWAVKTEVTEPKQKLGPEKFFSHGKKITTGYAYKIEATPKLEKPLDPTTIFGGGKNGGKNTGVYSSGNGLALTLGVAPTLGDRSNLTNGMNKYVVRKDNPWSAFVNPIYNTGKAFFDGIKKWITGVIWKAPVNPVYNTGKSFYDNIKKYITGRIWQALVNPVYNTGKNFYDNIKKYITGRIWQALVNPTYNTGKTFYADLSKYVTGKIWKALVNPTYNTGKPFFDILKKNITEKIFSAKVDPKYNSASAFFEKLKNNITGQIFSAKVNPKYGSGNDFFDMLRRYITGVTQFITINPFLSVTQSYKNDVDNAVRTRTLTVNAKLNADKSQFNRAISDAMKGASARVGVNMGGSTISSGTVRTYAQGGWPVVGDLFLANEAGPEYVASIGNKTAVANNDQIVEGIKGGVAQANSEQNELLRQQNSILMQLLNKDLTISPSVALGQVMARSAALYGRA